jgi:nucleoside-diphosphate-sugar epimerase
VNILLIGGTGFIGKHVVAQLLNAGHRVTVFHRGQASAPEGVKEILGDRNRISDHRETLAQARFDIVIDMLLSSEDQARQSVATFRGIARRLVAASSADVYRAWGVFYGTEAGGLQELPLTEDSDLRSRGVHYPPESLKRLQKIFPWATADYDKVRVERTVLSAPDLPGTVLRLPMVYGPGDPVHRFHYLLKRMDDGRQNIIFADDVAALRTPRGFVENVARAIGLAATSERASGRVYNVCEPTAFSELEWAKRVGAIAEWHGDFVVLPHDKSPKHLLMPGNTAQHVVVSSDRIRSELGYHELVPLDQAIKRTIAWEREHPPTDPIAQFDYPAEDEALSSFKAAS